MSARYLCWWGILGLWGCSGDFWGRSDPADMFQREVVVVPEKEDPTSKPEFKSSLLPYGTRGSHKSYEPLMAHDDWDPQALIFDRAFDYLTPTGYHIFVGMEAYLEEQKKPQFHYLAQPLQCVRNVAHILGGLGYQFPEASGYSVPHFLYQVQKMGGVVYHLPQYNAEENNRYELVHYLAERFPKGLPTGAIIAGCSQYNCLGMDQYGAHLAILGDKNEYGEVMVYHNNWLRPNNLKGRRIPYMVSLENFYMLRRPREWMATPWVYMLKDGTGKPLDFVSLLPEIDDLDPLSEKMHIKIALLPEILSEMKQGLRVPHHYELGTGNQHVNLRIKERKWQICRAKKPLRDLNVYQEPAGELNEMVKPELSSFKEGDTFLDYRFEFASLGEKDGWISALVYDAGRYWGGNDTFGALWLSMEDVECGEKGLTH